MGCTYNDYDNSRQTLSWALGTMAEALSWNYYPGEGVAPVCEAAGKSLTSCRVNPYQSYYTAAATRTPAPNIFAPRVFSIYATEETPETCYGVLGLNMCLRNPVVVGLMNMLMMDSADNSARQDPYDSMQGFGDRVY